MAVTRLAQLVVPEVFTAYTQVLTAQKSAFVQSGVINIDAFFSNLLVGGGTTFNHPFFNDLADTISNVGNDDPAVDAVPELITTGSEISIRLSRNQHWSSMDLAGQLAGPDPLDAIANLVADYWVRQLQLMLIASVQGVIADNEANDAGDMVLDIGIGTAPSAANLFSAEAFIDAAQTMGDRSDSLVAVAMHSVVFTRAQKNNLIDFIPDSRGEVDIPTFLGRRVIVDDGLPVVVNGSNNDYSTYLFGAGSFAQGVGQAKVPTETDRFPLAGRGSGQETLTNRVEWLLHPRGTAFTATLTDPSPTNPELATATSWDRRVERKLVRIAELRTNG